MGEKISELIGASQAVIGWESPQLFDLNKSEDKAALAALVTAGKVHTYSDHIDLAIEELYHIEHPSQIDATDEAEYKAFTEGFGNGDTDLYGLWVFYPWSMSLVHFPTQEDLNRLRGSRNRNLITDQERLRLKDNKTILILGLSVGSNVVDSLLMQGVGSDYVLADMDSLGPTNLNRIRASYDQLGVHKVDVVAKKISELDPFLGQVHYKDGVTEANLEDMLAHHKPSIIVDEMDSLKMKVLVRLRAKELGIPVLMATDDGDDILLDIERYDLDQAQPILHGILPQHVIDLIMSGEKLSRQQSGAIIGQYFVNLNYVPVRMMESLMEVGRSLPSWPQLGGAAVLSGLYVAYAAKKILLGYGINQGRFLMGPEAQLNPEIESDGYKSKKALLIEKMTQGPPA